MDVYENSKFMEVYGGAERSCQITLINGSVISMGWPGYPIFVGRKQMGRFIMVNKI